MNTQELKIIAYSKRRDEQEYFARFADKYGLGLAVYDETPSLANLHLARGIPCMSILTNPVGPEMVARLREEGVRFISTRTIGYDHIHLESAKNHGIRVGNAPYSPGSVAEYAVMFMLMSARKIKAIERLSEAQDFSLKGVQGRELRNLTVGVAGTGRIGRAVIRILGGFGCEIIAHDRFEHEDVRRCARYVSWEELLEKSDVVTLHMPATDDNFHALDRAAFARMKSGSILVNTARGSLIDTEALIEAVEAGKLSGAALDVVENEDELYYKDLSGKPIRNRELAVLKSFPNVIVTPHTAFYTDQAVSDMVENSLLSCMAFLKGEDNPWEVSLN